jgi:hypothetical protein
MKKEKTIIFDIKYLGSCGCGFKRDITRKIEMKETQTMDELSKTIIHKSFKWDDPHLFSFFMDNKTWEGNRDKEYASHPEPDQFGRCPHSSNIQLKEFNLQKKQKFMFVYDYGDDHQFCIKVDDFGDIQKDTIYPRILEEKGKTPRQYTYETR